tara:strand:- start:15709 stop:17178 length:1470 start_codon:yes stop_codon:yes gene_type:complete
MAKKTLSLTPSPVVFGTDGWRGVLGVDFTLERLLTVAASSAKELLYRSSSQELKSRTVIIGYDRRFLAYEMAEAVASAVRGCELDPLLTDSPVPTPACSLAVLQHNALGALVITASHNPPEWLGLKIKGPKGCSVEGDFTQAVERRIGISEIIVPQKAINKTFPCRQEHISFLQKKFDIPSIIKGLDSLDLSVIVDPMHGSAAGCIPELLGVEANGIVKEIRNTRDPLFGGNPPEPLAGYIPDLIEIVKSPTGNGKPSLGLVFDGDGDRIAAIDENGRYCSTQFLMPLLIDHLAGFKNLPGCVVKTVSGCDLMHSIAESHGREVIELPVGFKYIAKAMFEQEVLIGGEESGGIGFGEHIPERDALFTSLVLLEAIAIGKEPLGKRLDILQDKFGKIYYDRIDLFLESNIQKEKFQLYLKNNSINNVSGKNVKEVIDIDGVKLRLNRNHWLMFRFSGTEPLLRIYCEARSQQEVLSTLLWAKEFVEETCM